MKNILLVDDDSVCNFLTTKTLERMGLADDIHTALNGRQAIDLFNGYYKDSMSLPDIVLLDLNMPILDGFGFLEEFKRLDLANHDRVQIIVVSSSENPEDIMRAKNLGASRYIAKPLLEETLRKALENS